MKCAILANGDYGDVDSYIWLLNEADIILCADGGANYAYEMGVMPAYIVGDMDSILPRVMDYYKEQGVQFRDYPQRKDFTDTQLILNLAEEMDADEIVFLGSLGKRLDHTLSNIYCGAELALKGKKVWHYTTNCSAYLVNKEITINGEVGDMVSVLVLTDQAQGVYEEGFEYPLKNVILEKWNPYAISNVLAENKGVIRVREGLLLVIHYHGVIRK
ncbi:MAG TPA: thiamine diphosphokinase [Syntrophomonas sp.]|jgi:thiamine pyrophosphokinase|nr:thiamine diphosphokinase [Syntrophomonas sp.]